MTITHSRLYLGALGTILIAASLQFVAAAMSNGTPASWNAQWIASPDGPARDYDVVYFRKILVLPAVPNHFLVDVSGDTRFELHVNGSHVGAGPAKGDVHHWRYETYDLAPYLKAGTNDIAAIVWNFGTSAPIAWMSSRTAFLLSAEDPKNEAVDTGNGWQTMQEHGRTLDQTHLRGYYAAGPGEVMDGRRMHWGWDSAAVDASGAWIQAELLGHAAPQGAQNSATPWLLEKDLLPHMQYTPESAGHIVRITGMPSNQVTSLDSPVTIPAHSDVVFLLDRGVLTTAYPSLRIQGGKDSAIAITYAEALYDAKGKKGNRNEIAGRHIEGVADHIISNSGRRTYRTLWWRTWRYLQVEVRTENAPLTIEHLGAFYTVYPFTAAAYFTSDDPELNRIWEVGWRTAQLCAHETYMDTPYWEQLQYIGDTRIQALISYGVTGDDRLARQAMNAFRDLLLTNGLTQSRYPSSLTQVIPTFSLLSIGMLHDFWMYRDDPSFVKSLLPGTRGVLDWFSARQRPDGLLGHIDWWPFVDYNRGFKEGVPPQEANGGSSAMTLQFIEALRDAAGLEDHLGEKARATLYREKAMRASAGLLRLNWNAKAGLLADTPEKNSYSQVANTLAVWLDVIPKSEQRAVMRKLLAASSDAIVKSDSATQMLKASYYFRYYMARAMLHVGLGDEYIAQLGPWRKMLQLGLSTWAEKPEPTRSDSHAWSAHPTLDLLRIVAGIDSGSPGFRSVRIAPHLGSLRDVNAAMSTPKGLVKVHYTRKSKEWLAVIDLPAGTSGKLIWHHHVTPLHVGEQTVTLTHTVAVEHKVNRVAFRLILPPDHAAAVHIQPSVRQPGAQP